MCTKKGDTFRRVVKSIPSNTCGKGWRSFQYPILISAYYVYHGIDCSYSLMSSLNLFLLSLLAFLSPPLYGRSLFFMTFFLLRKPVIIEEQRQQQRQQQPVRNLKTHWIISTHYLRYMAAAVGQFPFNFAGLSLYVGYSIPCDCCTVLGNENRQVAFLGTIYYNISGGRGRPQRPTLSLPRQIKMLPVYGRLVKPE